MLALHDKIFRQAIDQYGAVIITTAEMDAPGPEIVYANVAFCEQTGYTEEELLGQTPRMFQGPETDRAVLDRLRTALTRESGFFDGQTINYRKDGTPYRVRWSIRPVRDERGKITHYISLQNRITDINVTYDELTRQTHLLKMAEKTARFGGWLVDLETHRIEWSNVVADIHGMPHDYSPSFSQTIAFYIPEHRERIHKRLSDCAEQGIPYDEELQIVAADGCRVWVRTLGEPIRDRNKRIIGVRGSLQDVTQRREREQELRKLAHITEQSPIPISVTDIKGQIEYVNSAFEQLSGRSRETLLGNNHSLIQSSHTPEATYRDLWQTISAGQTWSGEMQNRRQDGSPYWEHEIISPLTDDLGQITHYVAIKQDITAIKKAEWELSRMAFEDPLTRLYSRIGFTQALQRQLDKAGWPSSSLVVMVDIIGQRDINDAYGYDVGDDLLIQFGERLVECTGMQGLAGRIGGDEFMLFLPSVANKALEANLDQLLNSLAIPFKLKGTSIELSVRLGYTRLDEPQRSAHELLREAELALSQHRKTLNVPWIAYDHRLKEATQLRIQLTRELRQALDEDQFELHFQPKVDLGTGTLIACEALIRWNHPERGMIPPGMFIPIAEQSQLIAPIGDWVLRRACQHLRDWRDAGLAPVRVAVNVSVIQFQMGDFASRVQAVLDQSGVSPGELALEITESVFSDASDMLLAQMSALRDIGVRLSLDDFGTGYSSLLYLQQYPIDEIKIDQGFVFHLLDDAFSHQLVETVITLAQLLNADVIAEGIESAAVSNELIAMGCCSGQGYFYSMPLEAEDFRWLLEQRSRLPLNAGAVDKAVDKTIDKAVGKKGTHYE
ncbi:phosphodiesterase [Vreelandella andesensis]|uniref:Phosphodiesterase n=1 Tax=Vreelandella andesensis TaxID=447567 RepID=A0A433KLD8_9GAMM|nr:GGDEF domain-containing phosphodiesterase [Halomonas andesensis]RUR30393.1 phosphodiesterase [Halomonas andesensis]